MNVFIKVDDRDLVIDYVHEKDTVGDYKEKIAKHFGIVPEQVLIFFEGQRLTDDTLPLSKYGVYKDSMLHIKLQGTNPDVRGPITKDEKCLDASMICGHPGNSDEGLGGGYYKLDRAIQCIKRPSPSSSDGGEQGSGHSPAINQRPASEREDTSYLDMQNAQNNKGGYVNPAEGDSQRLSTGAPSPSPPTLLTDEQLACLRSIPVMWVPWPEHSPPHH